MIITQIYLIIERNCIISKKILMYFGKNFLLKFFGTNSYGSYIKRRRVVYDNLWTIVDIDDS